MYSKIFNTAGKRVIQIGGNNCILASFYNDNAGGTGMINGANYFLLDPNTRYEINVIKIINNYFLARGAGNTYSFPYNEFKYYDAASGQWILNGYKWDFEVNAGLFYVAGTEIKNLFTDMVFTQNYAQSNIYIYEEPFIFDTDNNTQNLLGIYIGDKGNTSNFLNHSLFTASSQVSPVYIMGTIALEGTATPLNSDV